MNESTPPVVVVSEERQRFRRKVRRVSVTVVLIVVIGHLVVGMVAAVFVVARYFEKPKAQFAAKPVEMKPEDRPHRQQMSEVDSMRAKPVLNNRIQSLKPSALMLPDLPQVRVDTAIPVDASAVSSDAIGATGVSAIATGTGTGSGFFGAPGKPGNGLLEGTFYDLKQTKDGKPTDVDNTKWKEELLHFMKNGVPMLQNYYTAPKKLFAAKMAIPAIHADSAPEEFGVQDLVKPRHWLTVYNARVIAPESGHYHFIGCADDAMLVYFRRKLVFASFSGKLSPFGGREGTDFTAQKGNAYDIQIVIGENPGGIFMAWLQIQKDKDQPHWFRLSTQDVIYKSTGLENPTVQLQPKVLLQGPPWLPAPSPNSL